MSDNKVTLDQLDSSAIEAMSSSVGDVNMLNTENKTIVGALAEIVGKKEIANAIGEPLAETDRFTEMSNEINGLLSTFKTNMMNAGVVVESGDKFKALIDKIKGLTEGEGNKGIQYAEGTGSFTSKSDSKYDITLDTPFGFLPTYVFIEFPTGYATMNVTQSIADNGAHYVTYSVSGGVSGYAKSFNDTSVTIYCLSTRSALIEYKWYAIGVGEEDTSLRDSLASILEGKGVDVTEEDDMVSLITKVDDMQPVVEYVASNNIIFNSNAGIGVSNNSSILFCLKNVYFKGSVNIMASLTYSDDVISYELIRDGIVVSTSYDLGTGTKTLTVNNIEVGDELVIYGRNRLNGSSGIISNLAICGDRI